jgi:hypothetical protein
MNLGNLDKT